MTGRPNLLCIGLMVLFSFLLLLVVTSQKAQATITGDAPPANGDWEVDQDTTVTNEIITLNGNLKVTNDATLTFDNVGLKVNSTRDGEFWVLIYSGSTYLASDSQLTWATNHSYGVYFQSGSTVVMDECLIEYASGNGEQGPYLISSDISITNTTLRENFNGAYIWAPAYLAGNTIYNNSVGLALMESLGANDVGDDNAFELGPFGNQEADVRYHQRHQVQIQTPQKDPVANAKVFLNDSSGREWLEGELTDAEGGFGDLYLAPWEITPESVNRSLEPYDLTAYRSGITNDSQYDLDQENLTLELLLVPELSIEKAGIKWGQRYSAVPAGIDNRTKYLWKSQGTAQELPAFWYAMNYTELQGWTNSPAPFGDQGVKYTNWPWNNHYGLFRHYFDLPDNIEVLSAKLKIASKDKGTYYLNGQLLFSDIEEENGHWQKYWNHEIPVPMGLLDLEATNYLACQVHVKAGNNQYKQFFDAEIEIQYVYNYTEKLVNYHHGVLKVPVTNNGTADVTEMAVYLLEEGQLVTTTTLTVPAGSTRIAVLDWLNMASGQLNYTILVDGPDRFQEGNENDNEATASIFVGDYEIAIEVVGDPKVAMKFNETHEYLLNVTNQGGVNDTVTLSMNGIPQDWSAVLNETLFFLEPGQTRQVTLTVNPKRGALQSNYTFTVQPRSSHDVTVYEPWVLTGRDNRTPSKFKVFENREQVPNDWYAKEYDDANWSSGVAPYGNQDLSWSQVGTEWDLDDSYLVTRKWFDFPDIPALRGAQLRQAFTNYLLPYVNGNVLHNEWGSNTLPVDYYGYWYITTIPNWMLDFRGANLIAQRARDFSNDNDPDNLMWLDYEVTLLVGKYEAGLDLTVQILPTRDFEVADTELIDQQVVNTTVQYPLDMLNYGNLRQTIDLELNITHRMGNWTVNFTTTEFTLNATKTVRLLVEVTAHEDLWVRDYLNLTISAIPRMVEEDAVVYYLNLTALLEGDEDPPVTRVRHVGDWLRLPEVELNWYTLNDTGDGAYYHLYIQTEDPDGNLSGWQLYDIFDVGETFLNLSVENGLTYYVYSLGQDVIGNLEKDKAPLYDISFTVDLAPPESGLWLDLVPPGETQGLLNQTELFLRWNRANISVVDDIERYTIEYRLEQTQDNWSAWTSFEGLENTTSKNSLVSLEVDGLYQLRSIAYDRAGWKETKSGYDYQLEIDTQPPRTGIFALAPYYTETELQLRLNYSGAQRLEELRVDYTKYKHDNLPSTLTWLELGNFVGNDLPLTLNVSELKNGQQYLFRIVGLDQAGNWEQRNEVTLSYTGDGRPDQEMALPLPPLPAEHREQSTFQVLVDTDRDGEGDLPLTETLDELKGKFEFYVDRVSNTVVFGDGQKGYKPPDGFTVLISYAAYDTGTIVDRTPPLVPEAFSSISLNEDELKVELQWGISLSKDVDLYLLESSPSSKGPWTLVEEVSVPTQGTQVMFTITDLVPDEPLYFRVLSQDHAGHVSEPNKAAELTWGTTEPESDDDDDDDSGLGLLPLLAIVVVLVMVGGAFMFMKQRSDQEPVSKEAPAPSEDKAPKLEPVEDPTEPAVLTPVTDERPSPDEAVDAAPVVVAAAVVEQELKNNEDDEPTVKETLTEPMATIECSGCKAHMQVPKTGMEQEVSCEQCGTTDSVMV